MNRVCQYRDQDAVPTLGPYGALLHMSLEEPPKDNMTLQRTIAEQQHDPKSRRPFDEDGEAVTLYRGLGLPAKAIEHYKKFLE